MPARGVAAVSVAIRFVSASIIRCRSAHLVEVRSNFRLLPVSECGERSNAAFGAQSAAEQTSHAPHGSKARLQNVTNRRRFMAKPCTPYSIPQAEKFFKIEIANVGGRGECPSSFLLGV